MSSHWWIWVSNQIIHSISQLLHDLRYFIRGKSMIRNVMPYLNVSESTTDYNSWRTTGEDVSYSLLDPRTHTGHRCGHLPRSFQRRIWPSANFYTIFAELGFPYHTDKLTKSPRLMNGGTIVFSRWSIEAEDSTVFSARRLLSGDYFAAKGVNYVKINKTVDGRSRFYHIMTAHFQSGRGDGNDKIRRKQARQWKEFIDGQDIPEHEPVILTGDINIDYWTQKQHLQVSTGAF